ncbi:MAG TPA: DinB family protein [Pyrinomonadaceae bacterium]|jgi:hypothetical protein|nr:DinB family protein [Pyrinomonadaceae bacterium]
MNKFSIGRPDETEYLPYYGKYISLVPDVDILSQMSTQAEATLFLLHSIPEPQSRFRYAPGKWSIRELVGHVIDTERIFAYRALRFSRNDQTPLNGYEQDDYILNSTFDDYPLTELAAEFDSVRRSNIFLFKHLTEEAWTRRGIANDSEASVRALAYIIAGHELHHMDILRHKYLPASQAISWTARHGPE